MDESAKCLYAVILGVIQGLTEFMPISSSAHLLLLSRFTDADYFGKAFDVALHGATLMALLLNKRELCIRVWTALREYLFRNLAEIRRGRLPLPKDSFEMLGAAAVICTLPAAALGFCLEYTVEKYFHSLSWISAFLILAAIVMYFADRKGQESELTSFNLKNFLTLGLFQSLALFPGVSRSGAVLTGARLMGVNRREAYSLSLLTAVPVIGGAFAVKLLKGLEAAPSDFLYIFLGVCAAFVTGLFCIGFMERLIGRFGLEPFVVYRCLLGLALLAAA
ncbi:undecaprenyl-diphosphate phosphatase [bacterium]|nr:undecaprenyl-diphosphate phosphatase [bacterium]